MRSNPIFSHPFVGDDRFTFMATLPPLMDPLQSAVVVVVIFIVVIVVIPIAIVTNTFGGTLNERKEM